MKLNSNRDNSQQAGTFFSTGTLALTYRVERRAEKPKVVFEKSPRPAEGQVVLMDGRSHVVFATGRANPDGIEVVSFSPQPIWGDGSWTGGKADVSPEVTTLEKIIGYMAELYPETPSDWEAIQIEFGDSPLFP